MSLKFKPRPRKLLIYILGWGRSGSSILANILGSMPDAASLGEARYLWDRGIVDNGICGCGETFEGCDFWPDLSFGDIRLGDVSADQAETLARAIGSKARPQQAPAVLNARARARYFEQNDAALTDLIKLYGSAFENSDSDVILDASKSPYFAVNLLHKSRDFDVAFLHLVRDPRAVVHSWKKNKQREDGGDDKLFPKYSSLRSLVQWRVVNSSCARFDTLAPDNYYRLRYEDFAADWRGALVKAAPDLFEMDEGGMDPAIQAKAQVAAQHSISGNPSRFNLGEITLKTDTAWQGVQTNKDQWLTSLICGSTMRKYGYDPKRV